jgi:hypothetical protein
MRVIRANPTVPTADSGASALDYGKLSAEELRVFLGMVMKMGGQTADVGLPSQPLEAIANDSTAHGEQLPADEL